MMLMHTCTYKMCIWLMIMPILIVRCALKQRDPHDNRARKHIWDAHVQHLELAWHSVLSDMWDSIQKAHMMVILNTEICTRCPRLTPTPCVLSVWRCPTQRTLACTWIYISAHMTHIYNGSWVGTILWWGWTVGICCRIV